MSEELKTLDIKEQSVDIALLNKINLKGLEIEVPKGKEIIFEQIKATKTGNELLISTEKDISNVSNIILLYSKVYGYGQLSKYLIVEVVISEFMENYSRSSYSTSFNSKYGGSPSFEINNENSITIKLNISDSYGYFIYDEPYYCWMW